MTSSRYVIILFQYFKPQTIYNRVCATHFKYDVRIICRLLKMSRKIANHLCLTPAKLRARIHFQGDTEIKPKEIS